MPRKWRYHGIVPLSEWNTATQSKQKKLKGDSSYDIIFARRIMNIYSMVHQYSFKLNQNIFLRDYEIIQSTELILLSVKADFSV